MEKEQALQYLDETSSLFCNLSDQIWDYAETAFEEFQSADVLCRTLDELGFYIEKGLADIETAFCGTWGSGYPVIGFLGEFDALPGLSQKAFSDKKNAAGNGNDNGHGCGHNMLGSGALGAAAAVKNYLEANKLSGTIKYFGCPGEEGGSGKAFMARDGIFDHLDIVYTWHPSFVHAVLDASLLANYQVLYKFKGTASHAAISPHLGRSALDAVELMNVGVNYLREHIQPTARVHYAVTNTGGVSPNVVQAEAEVLYLLRAPKSSDVKDIYKRINKIAEGAALMTETTVEINFVKSCAELIPNKTLFSVMNKNLHEIPMPEYSEEEQQFARQMAATLTSETFDKTALAILSSEDTKWVMSQLQDKPICDFIFPFHKNGPTKLLPGSSDVGDVSFHVPVGQIVTACYAVGTPFHTWQLVAQGKSSLAHKGLIYGAKIMAASAIDALHNDNIIKEAKKELAERLNGEHYHNPIPKETKPSSF